MIDVKAIWRAMEPLVLGLMHRSEARGCRAYRKATQSIASAVDTPLEFDTESSDTDEGWAVGDPTKLVAQREGYYLAGGGWAHATGGTGLYQYSVTITLINADGTTHLAANSGVTGVNASVYASVSTGMFWMNVGDYVRVFAYQNSGGAVTTILTTGINQRNAFGWLMRVG